MAFFQHLKRQAQRDGASHLNWMGGRSYDIADPLKRLRLAASSCFFGEPMYYHREPADPRPVKATKAMKKAADRPCLSDAEIKRLRDTLGAVDPAAWRALSPAALIEKAIDEALAVDPEATLAEAARLREEEHLRTTPQVILVRAANTASVRGTGLVRRFAPRIIQRADEPAVGLAYQLYRFGKPVPNALKRAFRDALARFDDHALAKYRLEGKGSKTVDVVNLVHPKSPSVDRLAKGALRATGRTWEAIISARGSNRCAWRKALPAMGHMALLRNLRNLIEAGVPADVFVPKLLATAAEGKQLPFRYYSAYQAVKGCAPGPVLDAVEQCLHRSLGQAPRFPGRVMVLCDNSGSAQGTTTSSLGTMRVSTIANLTGVVAGMRADEGHLGVFGDRLETFAVRKQESVFSQLDRAEQIARTIGMETENGVWLFWDRAIRERQRWDAVFVLSDMQAGHGGLYGTRPKDYADFAWNGHYIDVAKLVAAYRARVHRDVRVFLVQVAGYQDTLVPEFYDRTYILGGWGEGLLRFAAAMARE
ncbi:TROVE domain-containing protein [Sorangium sp. So ce1389]|uniref:TROVE domain-containing protein n=1 Tax=Sorangium sp. So ce1389 TaxID=3133336 RepID=UPI003F5DAF16